MKYKLKLTHCSWIFCVLLFMSACTNEVDEIDQLLQEKYQANIERGKNIRIIYSDSASVKVIIHAPVMERNISLSDAKDEFPKGILVEFLGADKQVYSWLKANSAVRDEKESKVTTRGSVEFYNDKNEKLETPELIWDEKEKIIYTDKLVRITQSEKGDTTYGFGFKANQDFTRFEIKKKVQGKVNVSSFVNAID
ncbi:MAG: LPS export ABC transporter periplasmic protein LptC [Saprospiraceae bacterium]|nr:LPS export ABC transporter periplasmic protein LptC [Saprospiraceae bacterium]